MANTLSHHVQAAFRVLLAVAANPFTIYTTSGSKSVLIPMIGDRIKLREKFERPRPKREAYTFEMLSTFHSQVASAEASNARSFLGRHALVFNTQCLGIFTGSRVSEYSQSKGPISFVSRVPAARGALPGSGLPVAFVAADFLFLNAHGNHVSHETLFSKPSLATQLQITFRHDKSGRNYSVRKYGPGKDWLCPIAAACKILYRASLLNIHSNDPICAYMPSDGSGPRYLRDKDVTDAMRKICMDTYPDPSHFLRINISRFASHSNRVTAAVALSQAGLTIDDIAHRLRWKPESVAFYLRESASDIGQYTADTIKGAQRNFC